MHSSKQGFGYFVVSPRLSEGNYVKLCALINVIFRGPIHGLFIMTKTDGFIALQSGLLPAICYQVQCVCVCVLKKSSSVHFIHQLKKNLCFLVISMALWTSDLMVLKMCVRILSFACPDVCPFK